jgi:hypothetical protein
MYCKIDSCSFFNISARADPYNALHIFHLYFYKKDYMFMPFHIVCNKLKLFIIPFITSFDNRQLYDIFILITRYLLMSLFTPYIIYSPGNSGDLVFIQCNNIRQQKTYNSWNMNCTHKIYLSQSTLFSL